MKSARSRTDHQTKLAKAAIFALMLTSLDLMAENVTPFVPPRPYALQRYEAGWTRNPFTLKTLPTPKAQSAWSKDLAIASIYGDKSDPTVSVVNIKTHERFRLKLRQKTSHGMELQNVSFGAGRRDTHAQIILGGELAEIHYDSAYLAQLVASTAGRIAPATLQLRQQSIQQRVEPPVLPIPASHANVSSITTAAPDTFPKLAGQSVNVPGGIASPVATSVNQDSPQAPEQNHSSSDAAQPSLAAQLAGLNGTPTRRYTFRTGNEALIPHPDPQ